jgi:hypothetical protein
VAWMEMKPPPSVIMTRVHAGIVARRRTVLGRSTTTRVARMSARSAKLSIHVQSAGIRAIVAIPTRVTNAAKTTIRDISYGGQSP